MCEEVGGTSAEKMVPDEDVTRGAFDSALYFMYGSHSAPRRSDVGKRQCLKMKMLGGSE